MLFLLNFLFEIVEQRTVEKFAQGDLHAANERELHRFGRFVNRLYDMIFSVVSLFRTRFL